MKLTFFLWWRLACAILLLALVGIQLRPVVLWAQDTAGITSPATGGSVSGAVPVMGTAVIDPFQRYELYYKQEPSSDDSYIYFDGNTRPVTNGQLGVWQTADLPSGSYTIRMRVVKTDGNYSEHFARNLSVNQQPATSTATPTPDEPTPTVTPFETPIPIQGQTPVAQPTPIPVQVEQPDLGETPTVEPSPTGALVALGGDTQSGSPSTVADAASVDAAAAAVEEESGNSFTQELGTALALDRLRERFFTGVRYSAGIFVIVFAIFAGKRLLEWTLSRAG